MSEKVLIIAGSTRRRGVTSRYAQALAAELGQQGCDVRLWSLAGKDVRGCTGCGACRNGYACCIDDDMQDLYGLIDWCDCVEVVSPVYFSGAPSQFKAVLDRLQPYWELRCGPNNRRDPNEVKRPLRLHVIGMGGDPYGFDPLVTTVRSAFGATGFVTTEVVDRVGWGQEGERPQSTGLFNADGQEGDAR